MSLNWIEEIEQPSKYLSGDAKIIMEDFGKATFIKLYSIFSKTPVHFSESHLISMKRAYIVEKYNGENVNELARTLNVSTRFVYDTISMKFEKAKS